MNATAPVRHFLDLDLVDAATLRGLLDAAARIKSAGARGMPLSGRTLIMIFEKPSMRTRVSFEIAMRRLGGDALTLSDEGIALGERESVADVARVLSRYADAIMVRTHAHRILEELAVHAEVPVINGLTDDSHPCQVVADLMTLEERRGPVSECKVAWCGDANNVAVSWIHAAARLGFALALATPAELAPPRKLMDWARAENPQIVIVEDPLEAAAGADCVVTDTWVSMGQKDVERRHKLLQPYQVNEAVMAAAAPEAIFLHCLPAHRGEEVTASVIDGPRSAVFDEAENRLYAQMAILAWCLGVEVAL